MCFQFDKTLTQRQPVNDQENTEMMAIFVLPLQSTKGHMHANRTIDIGCHKQRVMCAYIYGSDLREHVHMFTNKQAAYQPTQK